MIEDLFAVKSPEVAEMSFYFSVRQFLNQNKVVDKIFYSKSAISLYIAVQFISFFKKWLPFILFPMGFFGIEGFGANRLLLSVSPIFGTPPKVVILFSLVIHSGFVFENCPGKS